MTWAIIFLLALAVVALLWRFAGFRGPRLQLLGSALLVGLAGYAWQGSIGLDGAPKAEHPVAMQAPSGFAELRNNFLPQFDSSTRWLILSDSYARRGNSRESVGALRAGIKREPRNMSLWTGLGYALTVHGGGMNQAAELAYRRAATLAPDHPAPRFFYGLSLAESGEIDRAERQWRVVLAKAPDDVSWRPIVVDAIRWAQAQRVMAAIEQAR